MSIAVERSTDTQKRGAIPAPLAMLAAALVLAAMLLTLPLRAPVGPMYWDVFVYYDAANRILDGQVPVLDFFTPVGPLGYYLFAGMLWLFPHAQPTLIAHWSLLPLTAPLMALVLVETGARSRATAYALLVPFLIFALLPFNTRDYYPFPGSDGFGIYNRQVCQVLYVLVAALIFMRRPAVLAVVVTATVTALFFLKITGFVAACIICLYAFAAGRLPFRHAALAALAFSGVLALLELWNGLVTAYVADIMALVAMNSESLAPRFLQAASHSFGILLPASALIALSLWTGRTRLIKKLEAVRSQRTPSAAASLLDTDALWLGVVLFAGITFETQNTGSQAMIFAWPVVLAMLMRSGALMATPKLLVATFALAAAVTLPPVVNTVERAARAYVGAVKNQPLKHQNLKTLGAVNMRGDVSQRSETMLDFYSTHRKAYEEFQATGQLPSFVLYSDFDFQISHMKAIDRAIDALYRIERENGVRFETIMAINFVNPFPWLMERSAPRHIAIGADPTRAVPAPGPMVAQSVQAVDVALYPTCPLTSSNDKLFKLYEPFLAKHRHIRLDACYDAFIHPRFGDIR